MSEEIPLPPPQPIVRPFYQLRPWIPVDKVNWRSFQLCKDARVAQFIDDNWDFMADKIVWESLCANQVMLPLLDKRWQEVKHKVVWRSIGNLTSDVSIPFVEKHWEDVDIDEIHWWYAMVSLPIPQNIKFLDRHWPDVKHKVVELVHVLCGNRGAISLIDKHWAELEPHINNVDCWRKLFENKSTFPLLEKRVPEDQLLRMIQSDSRIRCSLAQNPHAVSFIEKHLNAIPMDGSWVFLSCNPAAMLTLDCAAMRQHARPFAEELAARVFTPARVAAWDAMGIDVEDL